MTYMSLRAQRGSDLPRPGGPQPARHLRASHPKRGRRQGPDGELRHLPASRLAAPIGAARRRPGRRPARRPPRLLPDRARGLAAARRLDRALPGLLARTPRSTASPLGGDGRMSTATETQTISLQYDLPHPPAKVWRALTDPELLAKWIMANDLQPEVGHAFTFRADPTPWWDGIVHCEVLEVGPERRLRYTWRSGP